MDEHLAARVAALEDERAILATLYRYGHALDYGLEAEWVGCFTPDARYEIRSRVPGTVLVAHGAEELAAFAAGHTRAPARFHKHFTADPVVAIDGDGATAESFYARLDATAEGVPYIFSFGRYRDRLCRCADGAWRFEERIAESEALSVRDRTPPSPSTT
jgi:hypothetical protein